jgi:predicted NBD/HSP70 family sugar kinase
LFQIATTPTEINMDIILHALEAGDEDIKNVIAEAGYYLGVAVACLVGVVNAQHIFIAGSAARFGDTLLAPIKNTMRRHSMSILADETNVNFSSLGQDIVIKGAASLPLANELQLI